MNIDYNNPGVSKLSSREASIIKYSLDNFVRRHPNFCTPLAKGFLSPENLLFCKEKVEKGIQASIEINNDFIEEAIQVLLVNPALSYSLDGVSLLNLKFINEQIRVKGLLLSQRRLYQKYYLQNNRLNAFPRPELTKPGKGEFPGVDISTYTLSTPLNRFRYSIWARTLGNIQADGTVRFHYYGPGAGCEFLQKPPEGNLWQ